MWREYDKELPKEQVESEHVTSIVLLLWQPTIDVQFTVELAEHINEVIAEFVQILEPSAETEIILAQHDVSHHSTPPKVLATIVLHFLVSNRHRIQLFVVLEACLEFQEDPVFLHDFHSHRFLLLVNVE